ncbi:transcription factor MafB [Uranotaenia lowii]|uniref:transcription factor MafB n=1 Tax=Uranotaenia lowii TaxID=190385 RepID=UPI0024796132|nr:transcription factor MafB [Uranotaenia lowii]
MKLPGERVARVMNLEEPAFADNYIQEFVLEHLESAAVKREDISPTSATAKIWASTADENGFIPIRLKANGTTWHVEERKVNSITPNSDFYPHPTHGQPVLLNPPISGVPSTPPETPPVVGSPNHTNSSTYTYYGNRIQAEQMESMMIVPQTMRMEQPLDLRPSHQFSIATEGEWLERKEYLQAHSANGFSHHHHHAQLEHLNQLHGPSHHSLHHSNRPQSTSSTGSLASPRNSHSSGSCYTNGPTREDLINDDMLIALSVRELNKRLHGCPRDQVVRLKQKRRTLKNRGYAQNCRSKRLQQRHDLEITNRQLQNEMHHMKMEMALIKQERDELRSKIRDHDAKMALVAAAHHQSSIHQHQHAPPPPSVSSQPSRSSASAAASAASSCKQQQQIIQDSTSSPEYYV